MVRKPLRRSESGLKTLPEVRTWSGDLLGFKVVRRPSQRSEVVGRPSRRSGSGRETPRRFGFGREYPR